MIDISGLQAAAGRFLASRSDLHAWEPSSHDRCTDLVSRFQKKAIDVDTLRAGLQAERIGTGPSTFPSDIAILSLIGPLTATESIFSLLGMGTSLSGFVRNLYTAGFDAKIKGIVVVTDSPGGSIRQVPEVAAAMRRVRDRKPIVAAVTGYAASAAYWIVSNASVIDVIPSASVGAIGIITERISRTKQLEREGVDVHVVSAGKYKHHGHEALPMSDAEQQALQARVDHAYTSFVDDVGRGRHVPPSVVRSGYGEGDLVDADDAVRFGMIDRISTTEDSLARMVASPSTFTALAHQRAAALQAQTDRQQRDTMHQELDQYRTRLRASMARFALR